MFRLYENDVVSHNPRLKVSEHAYRKSFSTERKLGFFKPKKDFQSYNLFVSEIF